MWASVSREICIVDHEMRACSNAKSVILRALDLFKACRTGVHTPDSCGSVSLLAMTRVSGDANVQL